MEAFDAAGTPYESAIYPAGTSLWPTDHFSWAPFFDNEANLAQSK